MRLLFFSYNHIPMFKDGLFKLDFFASDRVPPSDESVKEINRPLYSNNVIALAGINASGKTTALNLLRFAGCILNGINVNNKTMPEYFPTIFAEESTFRAIVLDEKTIFLLESTISITSDATSNFDNGRLHFDCEKIWKVSVNKLRKSTLTDWEKLIDISDEIYNSESLEWERRLLFISDEASAFNSVVKHVFSKREKATIINGDRFDLTEDYGDINDVVSVFDSRIENLAIEDRGRVFTLTFKGQAPLFLSRQGLEEVLSAGTVRGLGLVQRAKQALLTGGLLLVDEIENHLNRKLVRVILELFTSKQTNPNGATIVFTTHYPQLLDLIHRKDNVYFLARTSDDTTEVVKYSDRIKRIENKKSEVFTSNFIKGTAPKYTDVEKLKKAIGEAVSHVER